MLKFSALNIKSKDRILVKSVDFTVERGQICALVGESGSGKSLSCLSVLSLLPETLSASGSILFTDAAGVQTEMLNLPEQLRHLFALKKIAYVFQEPLSALNPVQKCGKQLYENLELCGYSGKTILKQKAEELLRHVELEDTDRILNAYPFQLSGGQRQRVMIAMALAGDPELIIADEPTTALDVLLQDGILGLLRRLCIEQGKSILLVSHDIDAVRRYADHIVVMYRGEIAEQGEAATIVNNPVHVYTKALLACKPGPKNKGKFLLTLSDGLEGRSLTTGIPEMHAEDSDIVKLQHTGKEFKTGGKVFTALRDISFSIRRGSALGLIGESGSGKSTVSRLLVNLEQASSGSIVFDFQNKKPLSSNIQMVFQDPFAALNPALQTGSMLKEVIRKHRPEIHAAELESEAIALLEKVGLSANDLKKYPNSFSGGQRQRLCIARALAAKPILLICDEATSALDLSIQAQILNLLKSLQISEGLSILMITHSMAVAAWFCDELVVLKNGEIVESGPTSVLSAGPKHPYTKAMMAHQ